MGGYIKISKHYGEVIDIWWKSAIMIEWSLKKGKGSIRNKTIMDIIYIEEMGAISNCGFHNPSSLENMGWGLDTTRKEGLVDKGD